MTYKINKVNWDYYIDMHQISKITSEVYGREYDVQMGEYSNGSYLTAHTDPEYQWNDYPAYVEDESAEYGSRNVETVSEAIEYWLSTPGPEKSWDRPEWQPEVWAVLSDLADKGHIPHGHYFISIDW